MNKLSAKLLLILTIFLFSASTALASSVIPGDITITNAHFGNSLYYIELENNSDKDIDLSGFEIISDTSIFLYPEDGADAFIIPKNYKILFANNISKLESTLDSDVNTVLVEIPKLKTNKYGGVIEIKDQLGVSIDKYSYESFVDTNIIPDPIFITASSNKNNISYDYFDAVFLDVTPSENSNNIDEKQNDPIIKSVNNTTDDLTITTKEVTPPLSINGYSISIVLVISFLIFFLFKYFTNTKKSYSYKNI